MMKLKSLTLKLESALHNQNDGSDASHDIHHARRVWCNAKYIAELEGSGDMRLLVAAAYLHDLVNLPKNSPQRAEASRLSAEAAQPILIEFGFGDADVAAIKHMITAHSFSADIPPNTLEAKILQDADRLESVGALGIARTFYIAGKLGSQLFNGSDPFANDRPLDDLTYAVDHFKVKLLGLVKTMNTTSGKELAQQRTETMHHFLDALASELTELSP